MKALNLLNLLNKLKLSKYKLTKLISDKIDKKQKICLFVGIILSILSIIFNETIFVGKNEIMRNPYGSAGVEYTLEVKGLEKANEEIKFNVSSRRYTKETADIEFDEIFLKLADYILLENSSYDEIRSNLNLIDYFSKEGIYADYLFKLDES